jgi:hypothetical protein
VMQRQRQAMGLGGSSSNSGNGGGGGGKQHARATQSPAVDPATVPAAGAHGHAAHFSEVRLIVCLP